MLDQAMLDRRTIEQVLVAYCDAVDSCAIGCVGALFTDDAIVDYGPRFTAAGRARINELFEQLRNTAAATSHHLSNVQVDLVAADTARTMSYVTAWHKLVRPDGRTLVIHGRYLDRLQRVDGRWQIAERRLEVHGSSAPAPFHHIVRYSVAEAPT